jgi:hypothetical protein
MARRRQGWRRPGEGRSRPDAAGRPDIFVIGDTALVVSNNGIPVPGVAPAAKQMGRYAAEAIRRRLAGKPASSALPLPRLWQPRHHRPQGCRRRVRRLRFSGLPAWLVWSLRPCLLPHRLSQPPRRRSSTGPGPMSRFDRGARLITGTRREDGHGSPGQVGSGCGAERAGAVALAFTAATFISPGRGRQPRTSRGLSTGSTARSPRRSTVSSSGPSKAPMAPPRRRAPSSIRAR